MLHTEPSFSVYADEDGLLDSRNGDMKVKIGSDEFSFTENMGLSVKNRKDDLLSGFKDLGVLDAEEDYKRMLDEDHLNPVYLKKYAHLLQLNGDVKGAEEYYFRATMADPKDGETLMQYAKLVWELRHDQDRALGYFQSAVQASPHDPNVLAAYARFLWEIDEDEEEKNNESIMLPVNVDGLSTNEVEEYYNKMIQANPSNSDVLAAYAKFLWEADDQED